MTGAVLIEADELARALTSSDPPLVLDARWTLGGPAGLGDFKAGHIPGAQWLDLDTELAGPPGPGGRHPLPPAEVFQAALRRVGLRSGVPVVACDAANSMAAARLWWMLTDAGHHDVRVLNGGFAAWLAAGLPTESGPAAPASRGTFVIAPGQRPQVAAEQVLQMLADPTAAAIVDVRAAERYSGAAETVDPVAGHIPGAVNLPTTLHTGADGRFSEPHEISARLDEAGVSAASVVYCGSGVTAAHTLLAMELAGVSGAALYAGSWSNWITDPKRPIATGAD